MPKQVNKYDKERKEVLNKMFQILGINESNNKFLLHELDADIDKQNQILELEPDIKKYFICGSWSCFRTPDIKRKPLSIIKCLLKEMDYVVLSSSIKVTNDDNTISNLTKYNILKNAF
jgi:hypothetical protein